MQPKISHLDHVVLTVADIATTVNFYRDGLGMQDETFFPEDGTRRTALKFASGKINLHQAGAEFSPRAYHPVPGSGDLCLITETPLETWLLHLASVGIDVIEGPVPRAGASGDMMSIYVRDPDGNLVEIAKYDR